MFTFQNKNQQGQNIQELKMMTSPCPTLPTGTSNPTISKPDSLFLPYLCPKPLLFPLPDSSPLLTTFSLPAHLIPSCLFWLLNISQYVLITPFPLWFLLWRPPWPQGNSLLTGRAGSLEYRKLPTHCQGGRSFWISNLIIHSSQVPSASCLTCKASRGIYISSLNPAATARQCLSLRPDLLSSLWLKSILSHVLPLPPQILLPSSNPKNPCTIPSRIILQLSVFLSVSPKKL